MKVTVTKYLNVRAGSASLNAPCYQYLAPGSELEVDEKLYKGDPFEGSDDWMKDEAGNYYWAGGLDSSRIGMLRSAVSNIALNYNTLIPGIPDTIRNTMGKGVTIAVIDSGCSKAYDDLQQRITARYDAYSQTPDADDASENSHGTFIAGLLCADSAALRGIVPEAKLIIVKVLESLSVDRVGAVKEGLDWLLLHHKNDVDIINMSMAFEPGDYYEDSFKTIFSRFLPQTMFVASAGDNAALNKLQGYYPARYPVFTGVGAITPQKMTGSSTINASVHYLYPDAIYNSYGKKGSTSGNGSSYAAAITSGLMALYIADYKAKGLTYDKNKLLQDCDRIAGKTNTTDFTNNVFKPYLK